ncbi:MAG: LPXTG cell wall anchor domain-containing protein [Planctomycetaceae bacterium]|jgi:LPXTG-motif cell wall-anchored protein|nr:LPXTG cell wall anchor domain-containing protein [Planctomycetaceae bacterium]
MFDDSFSIWLSPFAENVNAQWINVTFIILSVLMFFSTALSIAREKSWAMYFGAVIFLLLAGYGTAPIADARSPRELQHWFAQSSVLATLSALQICWIGITVFWAVKEELSIAPQKNNIVKFRLSLICFLAIFPSPVWFLFLIGIEQNLFIHSETIHPQTIGISLSIVCCFVLTLLIGVILLLSKRTRIGLHLLTGCLVLSICSLLPVLPEKLYWNRSAQYATNSNELFLFAGLIVFFILIGIIFYKKKKNYD